MGLTALGSKQQSLAGKADALPRVMVGATIAMCVIIIACLGIVFWISFIEGEPDAEYVYTLRNYVSVTLDSRTYEVLWNTLGFAFSSLAVAFFFGIPAAWLVERTNLPGKTIVFTLMTIGLLMPGFAAAMGWLFLMHPRIGLLNTLLIGVLRPRRGAVRYIEYSRHGLGPGAQSGATLIHHDGRGIPRDGSRA